MEWMVSPAVLFALLNVIIVALVVLSSSRRNRGGNADAAEQQQHLSSKLARFLSRNFTAKQIPYQAAPSSSNDPFCETLQPVNERVEEASRESLQNTEQIPATGSDAASSQTEKPFRRASSREAEKSDALPPDEEGETVKDMTEDRVTEAGSGSGKPRAERRSSSEIKSKSAGLPTRKAAAGQRLQEDVSGEISDPSMPLPPPVPPAIGSESLLTRLVSYGRRSRGDGKEEHAAESHTAEAKVDADAENFIRRFKNQLKMQRYESFLRYRNTTGT